MARSDVRLPTRLPARLSARLWRWSPVLVAFALGWALLPGNAGAEGAAGAAGATPGAVVDYDGGAAGAPQLAGQFRGTAQQLFIALLDDCEAGSFNSTCGNPPVRWASADHPVGFCTFQAGRPSNLTAQQFRDRVQRMADTWSTLPLALGVEYTGDCPTGSRWEPDNRRNEIGFDDERDAVRGTAAGLTQSVWAINFLGSQVSSKDLLETDIILEPSLGAEPEACFNSVILHEMGHALGLGHSDDPADLMFRSFVSGDVSSCPQAISAAERDRLRGLYGSNATPTVQAGADQQVAPGAAVTLTASASDPDGDPVTVTWTQTAGPQVTVQAGTGTQATFTAPAGGGTLTFTATARDRYRHAATDTVTVTVGAGGVSAGPLRFDTFGPDSSGSRVRAGWIGGGASTTFEICSGTTRGGSDGGCQRSASRELGITWDRVLGAAGAAGVTRTEGGARYTKIRACDPQGCSAFVDGPVLGGLRWSARNIDYDYFAMAFDIGGVQFTIAGVVNLSSTPRSFQFHNGPSSDPGARRFGSCAGVASGSFCFGQIGVGEGRQHAVVQITSPGGTRGVTTRHLLTVR